MTTDRKSTLRKSLKAFFLNFPGSKLIEFKKIDFEKNRGFRTIFMFFELFSG